MLRSVLRRCCLAEGAQQPCKQGCHDCKSHDTLEEAEARGGEGICPKSSGKNSRPGRLTAEARLFTNIHPGSQEVGSSSAASQNGQDARVHVCVCIRVCTCTRAHGCYRFQGSARDCPSIQTAEAQAGRALQESSRFLRLRQGPRPTPPAHLGSALVLLWACRAEAPRPACLPCNRIVYIIPPSRNKTTESNIANRCLRPEPRVPARCSFEHPGRREAGSLVLPDPAGWGVGGCRSNGGLGAIKLLSETERGGNRRRKGGHTFFFLFLLILSPRTFQPCDLPVS